jgi:hypothetical protein
MKEHTNKPIEKLVDKVMKSSSLETPSFDFTAKVMSQVMAHSKSGVTVYKPLFSKSAWVVLLLVATVLIAVSVYSNDSSSLGLLDKLDLSKLPNLFSGIKISQTAMYSLLMFAIMMCIQVPLLKHYFNKRFEV